MTRWCAAMLALVLALPLQAQPAGGAAKRDTLLSASREIIAAARYATMVTNGINGQPSARIIDAFAPDADFTVWIGTLATSRKVAELRKDPRVTLMYYNAPDQEYVTLYGRATFVTDDAARAAHWKDAWASFYKDAWRGADYTLIRVTVTKLEVLAPKRAINNDPATWKPPTLTLP